MMLRVPAVAPVFLVLAALAAGTAGSPARGGEPRAPRDVSWVEGSDGLEVPGMDEGDSEFEFTDVNGDGFLDIVSVGDHGNPGFSTAGNEHGILTWLGDGACHWSHRHFGELGYGGIAAGDVNGDGLVDVGYGIHHNYSGVDLGDQLLEVALGDGTGEGWTAWDDGLATNGEDWGMFATDFGDIDADGDLDIGSLGFGGSGGFQVYFNRGDGTWTRAFGYVGGYNEPQVYFGDVDGDGALDVVGSRGDGTVWLGDGDGFFSPSDLDLPAPQLVGVGIGDVDGDGRDDVSFCRDGDPEVRLRRDDHWQDASATLPATGTCEWTQLADMDGDGTTDLVELGNHHVRVFRGDGGTAWTLAAEWDTPEDTGHVRAARVTSWSDVDHNGLPDIVLMASRTHGIFEPENVIHLYREASSPEALAVRVVAPGPHRVLLAGQVRWIAWTTAVPGGGSAGTATIEFSAHGNAGPWETVADGVPNAGIFQWTVPPRVSEDCRVRVTVTAGSATASATSAPFRVRRRREWIDVRFSGRTTLEWTDAAGRDRWNVYRGDLAHYLETGEATQDPAEVPGAGRTCDLAATTLEDDTVPGPGRALYWLVTGYHLLDDGVGEGPDPMGESPLGQRTDATMRRNAHPCPR